MRNVKVAITQMASHNDWKKNCDKGEALVREAAHRAAIGELRRSWGVFRDRRPDLYGALITIDGRTKNNA